MLVEVCANSLESALNAQEAGAGRIELCSALGIGGLTPSAGLLQKIKSKIHIPVHVLIRPRGGDFTYSDLEFEVMLSDIEHCLAMGFDGIVSGVLHKDFTLDKGRTAILKKYVGSKSFTFHRAFDWITDPMKSLEELEEIGVDTILTSGQQQNALLGLPLLKELKEKSKRTTILVGGGVNALNVSQFKKAGFSAVHLSGTIKEKTMDVAQKVSMNAISHLEEGSVAITSKKNIQALVTRLK